jgi:hypothetical protein
MLVVVFNIVEPGAADWQLEVDNFYTPLAPHKLVVVMESV